MRRLADDRTPNYCSGVQAVPQFWRLHPVTVKSGKLVSQEGSASSPRPWPLKRYKITVLHALPEPLNPKPLNPSSIVPT